MCKNAPPANTSHRQSQHVPDAENEELVLALSSMLKDGHLSRQQMAAFFDLCKQDNKSANAVLRKFEENSDARRLQSGILRLLET